MVDVNDVIDRQDRRTVEALDEGDCRRCRGAGAIGRAPDADQPGWRDPQCADWVTCPVCGGTG